MFQLHQVLMTLNKNEGEGFFHEGLVPVLNHFAEEGSIVDLQDVFGRFTFDAILMLVTGSDPRSLSIEMHEDDFAKALDDVAQGVLYRHIKPRFFWKLQNLMGFGHEKKMLDANATFDRVCAKYISTKKEEIERAQGMFDISNRESEDLYMLVSFKTVGFSQVMVDLV
ncbi:unnamed protein product [Cochlearia groenlandica]